MKIDEDDDVEVRLGKSIYKIFDRTGWTAKHSINIALGQFEHCLVSLTLSGALFWVFFCGKIGVVWWFAAACSWVSDVVCSSKIDMGMVMDLVVGFSIFAVRGGGDG